MLPTFPDLSATPVLFVKPFRYTPAADKCLEGLPIKLPHVLSTFILSRMVELVNGGVIFKGESGTRAWKRFAEVFFCSAAPKSLLLRCTITSESGEISRTCSAHCHKLRGEMVGGEYLLYDGLGYVH